MRNVDLPGLATGLGLFVALAVTLGAIWVDLVLSADGSYFFIMQMELGDFHLFSPARINAEYFYQLPMQLAIELGVGDPKVLLKLHGLGSYWLPATALFFCVLYTQNTLLRLACLLSFALAHLPVWALAFSEAHFSAGLFWVCAVILSDERALNVGKLCALTVFALLLSRSYESVLVLAPLLLLALYLRRGQLVGWPLRLAAIVFASALLVTVYMAVMDILAVRDVSNRAQFFRSFSRLIGEYYLLHMMAVAAIILFFASKHLPARMPLWIGICVMLLGVLLAWSLLRRTDFYLGFIVYASRVLLVGVPAGIFIVFLVLRHCSSAIQKHASTIGAGLAILAFTLQFAIQYETQKQWLGYQGIFRDVLASPQLQGMTDIAGTRLGEPHQDGVSLEKLRWPDWNLPLLSVIWSPDGLVSGALVDVEARYHPYKGLLPRLPPPFEYDYYPFASTSVVSPQSARINDHGSVLELLFQVADPSTSLGRVHFEIESAGWQKVQLYLNEARIGEFQLWNDDAYGAIKFDPALLRQGENRLQFRMVETSGDRSRDSSRLALRLKKAAVL